MKAHVYSNGTFVTDQHVHDLIEIVCVESSYIHDARNVADAVYLPLNWTFTPSSLFAYRPVMRPPKQRIRLNMLDG